MPPASNHSDMDKSRTVSPTDGHDGKAAASETQQEIDEKLLEALASDTSGGEAPAVMREVARLHQENRILKKRNVRVWTLALAMGGAFGLALAAALFLFPKYRYIPTTDNRALCSVSSDTQVRVTPAALTEYAKDAVVESYTYDYVNYRSAINDVATKRYTDSGRKQYLASLQDSGNLERVIKGRLILRTMATRTPQVEEEGRRGARRYWGVMVPVAIEFYSGGEGQPRSRQDFMAHVTILEQEASAVNLKGIAVDSLVLSPISTQR